MEPRPAGPRQGVFWAITLLGPLVLGLCFLELGLRLYRRSKAPTDNKSLAARLDESARTEVAEVRSNNLKGLVMASAWPDVVYELKPNHRWIFLGATVRTNSRAFRGREYPLEKAPGTFRIAGIGDSVMFGWGVEEAQTYMSRLEGALGEGGRRVEALNFGVPGYNTVQEVALFRERVVGFRPDALIVNYCLNDWTAPFFLQNPDDRRNVVERFELINLVSSRLHRNVENDDYFRNPGMERVDSALDELARLASDRKIPVLFFVYPEKLGLSSRAEFRKRAEGKRFLYIDMYDAMDRFLKVNGLRGPKLLYLSPNDSHPNPEGHRMIAEALDPVLRSLMGETGG